MELTIILIAVIIFALLVFVKTIRIVPQKKPILSNASESIQPPS